VRVRVKICCIADAAEAAQAVAAGADLLGLVSAMPSGPGILDEGAIARIAAGVPPGVTAVLLTAATEVDALVDQQHRTGVGALQLVNPVAPADLAALRRSLPGIGLLQVVHVEEPGAEARAEAAAPAVDALLLDSGRPSASVPTLGGTGRVHDWQVSARIAARTDRPVLLAGGLTPANVGAAVHLVRPFGVDVCSGVRREGRLDPDLVAAFGAAVARAGG
jgi:phosphoribosylanthranilate isomerase